jgi:hypothetical protein
MRSGCPNLRASFVVGVVDVTGGYPPFHNPEEEASKR